MHESNPYIPPRSPLSEPGDPRIHWFATRQGRATALGCVANACALLGLLAFEGYGRFATLGIHAVHAGELVRAHRMAAFAGAFSTAQVLLGLLAVGLGWGANAGSGGRGLARWLGASALGFGVLVLALLLVLV